MSAAWFGLGGLDSHALIARLLSLPEGLLAGGRAASLALETRAIGAVPASVVCCAIGHEAIAAEMLVALLAPVATAPACLVIAGELPAFVGPSSLVIAIAGPTAPPETLGAARSAIARGAQLVVIAPAGDLSALARQTGALHVALAPGRGARDDLGAVLGALLTVVDGSGVAIGADALLRVAADELAAPRARLAAVDGGVAAEIARRIGRTFPVITGGAGVGEVAARRWAAQITATAKVQAFSAREPERSTIGVAGFGQAGDITRQLVTLVELRRKSEAPPSTLRFELVERAVDEAVAGILEQWATGSSPLAELMDLVLTGDLVALHLATREGLDPGPQPVVEELARTVATAAAEGPTLRPGGP